ncbi:ABC transporter permease subunit [Streptomyces sp. SID13031]|uniref:ABC transporter permease subunit n=1 Tax=Streptomyces sp. SID13031 TaxID=2706046 RepID=UPI0013C85CE8|nr:ABC transporter permease subunit [Streptomyces sp. SID13031]NEA36004.1 ABC transporter permease subunit [Streptomyces sp. SID13031]
MINAVASEGLLMRKRSAPLIVGITWILMVVGFAFVVPYIIYSVLDPSDASRGELLDILLPNAVAATSLSSYPLFGGAIMLILGVLVTGSEYRWGTWTARLSQGPGRVQVLLAKLVVGAIATTVIAFAAAVAAVAASAVIGALEGRSADWPSIGALAGSLGAAALISAAWMSVGAALGVIFRGTTVALAVGLLWTLGLENALSGLAGILPGIEPVRTVLLGSASGSLVAGMGAPTQSDGGTPGVVDYLSTPAACFVLVAYIVVSTTAAAVLIRRRDIT